MGNHEMQEERRPGKKKTHRLYAFVVLLLGAAILALGILILFYVQKIEVSGNEYCSDQQIVDVVKEDKYAVNTLYIAAKYALGKGETLPCLDAISVRLTAPWAIKVTVREKPIVGYVNNGDQYAYFDKEGLVIYESTVMMEGLPCIEGIDLENIELYSQLETDSSKIFEEILETSQEVKKYDLNTDKIVCKGNDIYLYIGTVYVNLGSKVSSEQIAQIKPILEKLEGQEGTLHLENYSDSSGTITFDIGEIPE